MIYLSPLGPSHLLQESMLAESCGSGDVYNQLLEGASACLQEMAEQRRKLLPYMIRPDRCLHFLRPGRLVRVQEGPNDWGWGIVLSVREIPTAAKQVRSPSAFLHTVMITHMHSTAVGLGQCGYLRPPSRQPSRCTFPQHSVIWWWSHACTVQQWGRGNAITSDKIPSGLRVHFPSAS